jgi:geranylgeranyl pyrophosphate synthase
LKAVNLKKEIQNPSILYELMDMNSESELMEKVKGIIEKRGRAAIEKARQEILDSQYNGGAVSSALKYFARVTLQGGLPVFPALISLSCEAVGGKTEKTTSIGAALTLIAGAADIHDDIIDQSTTKYSKKTVFGKFGSAIALLAGDALLMQGLMFLHRECESLPKEQRQAILSLIPSALFEISNAEAKETRLMRKLDTKPQEYFEVIRLKAVVPEVHCKIGGILGNANEETVQSLGHYGRTFGIVSTVRDEFIDLLEYPELRNRMKNECPPLPMLYALQNSEIKKEVKPLVKSSNLTKKDANKIVKIVLNSKQVQELKKRIDLMIREEVRRVSFIIEEPLQKNVTLLLQAMIEGL